MAKLEIKSEEAALLPIEQLLEKHKTKPWIKAGVMTSMGWVAGKHLTEKEFLEAVDYWLKSPMAGLPRKSENEVK